MTDIFRLNNTIYSWLSCSFKIDLIPYNGVLGLDYDQKRERKVVHGAKRDGRALGKTAGKYTVPTCSARFLKDTWDKITTYLTTKGLGSYGDAEFTIIIQCVEPGNLPITILLTGCTIDGVKAAHQEGIDELVVEVEIGCLEVIENGKRLASVARALPV